MTSLFTKKITLCKKKAKYSTLMCHPVVSSRICCTSFSCCCYRCTFGRRVPLCRQARRASNRCQA